MGQNESVNKIIVCSLFSLFLASCRESPTNTGRVPFHDTYSPSVAASITLSATSLDLSSLGETQPLTATIKDQKGATMASATVTWSSSSTAVATVSDAGLVTSVANGTATITAKSGSATATASVTVQGTFYLAANGVTLVCSPADVGDTGEVGGVTYTKRSKAQIRALVTEGDHASLTTTCTSSVMDMHYMFATARAFNQDISSWDVSSVTNMYGMFRGATSFNQGISSWDVSNVTNMNYMFYGTTSFNQNLSGWCVSTITSEPGGFHASADSWVLPRPVWGTCPS